MRYYKLIIVVLFFLIPLSLQGAIYRWVDSNNIVHFSDVPHKNSTVEHVQKVQTFSNDNDLKLDTIKKGESTKVSSVESPTVYTGFSFVQPAAKETIHSNQGNVEIVVDVTPPLSQGSKVTFELDNIPVFPNQKSAMVANDNQVPIKEKIKASLSGVERGAHTLTAKLMDGDGQVLKKISIIFYIYHASQFIKAS